MQGRLNSFQRTMLQWNDLHPYSAIHVVQIPGVLDEARLRGSLEATLQARGLTNLTLDRAKAAYRYEGGQARCEVKVLGGCHDSEFAQRDQELRRSGGSGERRHSPEAGFAALSRGAATERGFCESSEAPRLALFAEMERQLNTPFVPAEQFSPFRFFAAPAGDSFFLGLTYFHPAADAESVVLLMKDLAEAYLKKVSPQDLAALDLYPDSRSHLLLRHARVMARRLVRLPVQFRLVRHSHRPRYRDAADFRNGFTFFSLAPENLRALVAAGKAWHVTVNDLLMALLMKALSPLAGGRLPSPKRRNISLGCIVNLRRELQVDSHRTFGLFLGSFAVTHEVPEGGNLRSLAEDIARQTLAIKQHKLYLGTPLELAFARFMLRFFSPERRKKFYQKHYPLWGGITNMNLNSLWGGPKDPGPMDYFRGVSTGPATPLVLSVTTVGDRANVGLSYRSTVFLPEDIENVKCGFLDQLEQLKESA